jgi:hypothetical protein
MFFTTKKFWSDLAERAASTAGQAFVGVFSGSALVLQEINWALVGGTVGVAVALSVGKAFALGRSQAEDPTKPDA